MPGKAKVTQLHNPLLGQQHVLWLQVPVHHLASTDEEVWRCTTQSTAFGHRLVKVFVASPVYGIPCLWRPLSMAALRRLK